MTALYICTTRYIAMKTSRCDPVWNPRSMLFAIPLAFHAQRVEYQLKISIIGKISILLFVWRVTVSWATEVVLARNDILHVFLGALRTGWDWILPNFCPWKLIFICSASFLLSSSSSYHTGTEKQVLVLSSPRIWAIRMLLPSFSFQSTAILREVQ